MTRSPTLYLDNDKFGPDPFLRDRSPSCGETDGDGDGDDDGDGEDRVGEDRVGEGEGRDGESENRVGVIIGDDCARLREGAAKLLRGVS